MHTQHFDILSMYQERKHWTICTFRSCACVISRKKILSSYFRRKAALSSTLIKFKSPCLILCFALKTETSLSSSALSPERVCVHSLVSSCSAACCSAACCSAPHDPWACCPITARPTFSATPPVPAHTRPQPRSMFVNWNIMVRSKFQIHNF